MYWIFFCYSLFRCRCRFYLQVRKVVDTNEKEKIQGSSPWHKLEMYNIYRQFVYHMLTDIMPWIGVTVESKFIFIYFYGFLEHQSIFWASSYYIKVCRDFVLYNNFFTKHWVLYTCEFNFQGKQNMTILAFHFLYRWFCHCQDVLICIQYK